MAPWKVTVAVLVAILLGVAAGYLYRRWERPVVEERARDVANELKGATERSTK
jgi:hypothetical protein